MFCFRQHHLNLLYKHTKVVHYIQSQIMINSLLKNMKQILKQNILIGKNKFVKFFIMPSAKFPLGEEQFFIHEFQFDF